MLRTLVIGGIKSPTHLENMEIGIGSKPLDFKGSFEITDLKVFSRHMIKMGKDLSMSMLKI